MYKGKRGRISFSLVIILTLGSLFVAMAIADRVGAILVSLISFLFFLIVLLYAVIFWFGPSNKETEIMKKWLRK